MITLPVQITESTLSLRGKRQGDWTADDWDAPPHDDGNRCEIIEGVLYLATAPSAFHQWIIARLICNSGFPAEDSGQGIAFASPIGVFMPGTSPAQPDFLFIRAERTGIIRDRSIYGEPDLTVEVLSPGSFDFDYDQGVKLDVYALAGVQEYAVINPAECTLTHFRLLEPGRYDAGRVLRGEDLVAFDCLPGLTAPVHGLFDGAPDTTL